MYVLYILTEHRFARHRPHAPPVNDNGTKRTPMIRPTARHVLPEFHERTTSGLRVLDPYSKLLEERIVFLGTQVDDTSANDVVAQLMHLEHADPDRDISI